MKKRILNFWYYYKVYVIIILIILAAGFYVLSLRKPEKSDYDAAVVSPDGISGEQLSMIKSVLEKTGIDQTGDGAVNAEIHVYRFAIGEDGQDPGEIAGLDADLVGKQSGLFFAEDPERFEHAANGIGKASDAVPVKDIPLFSDCGIDDLYLLIRTDAEEKYVLMFSALTAE